MKLKIIFKKTKKSQSPEVWQNACQTFLFQFRTEPDQKQLSLITNKTKWTEKVPKIAIFFSFSAQNVPEV